MTKSETKAEVQERREPTPDELTDKAKREAADAARAVLVEERADERPLDAIAYPTPATSSWVVVPDDDKYWGPTPPENKHMAVQVVQVHDYPEPNVDSVVTLRADSSYEWRLTWDQDTAVAIYEATAAEQDRRAAAGEPGLER